MKTKKKSKVTLVLLEKHSKNGGILNESLATTDSF